MCPFAGGWVFQILAGLPRFGNWFLQVTWPPPPGAEVWNG